MRPGNGCSKTLLICALVAGVMVAPFVAAASERTGLSNMKAVQLKSGITYVDLDGDAVMDMVTKALTNYGRPSKNWVYRFLLRRERPGSTEATWIIVPVEKSFDDNHVMQMSTYEYEGCTIRDVRLLTDEQDKESPATLIMAKMDGEAHHDNGGRVRFFVFRFYRDPYRVPGWPEDYFRMVDIIEAESRYCDVNEAFRKELGLE